MANDSNTPAIQGRHARLETQRHTEQNTAVIRIEIDGFDYLFCHRFPLYIYIYIVSNLLHLIWPDKSNRMTMINIINNSIQSILEVNDIFVSLHRGCVLLRLID